MLSQLILYILIAITFCGWTRTPQIKIDKFNQTKSKVQISTEDFKHLKYPNTYDLELYYKEGLTDSLNISEFQKINDTDMFQQGCSFFEKKIKVEDQLSIQLPDDGKFYFTDLITIKNQAYLLRNDNKIFTASLDFTGFDLKKMSVSSQHLDFSQQIRPNLSKKPKFLLVSNQLFIFTETGAISFNYKEWTNGALPSIINHTLDVVINIYQIYYDEILMRVFIVAGKQGVIVYELKDQQLNKLYTINLNLNLIKVQTKDDQLFILDDKKGIHFITLDSTQFIEQEFFIPLENPISFIYNQNSFLVVAQTQEKIIFGIEILIHFKNQEFYYNKFYLEDMQLKDVQSCGEFQYLIGYDVHKIIQTNIFRGFVDDDFDYDTDFMVPLLEKIEDVDNSNYTKASYNYHYSLALTPHFLYGLIIKERIPEIICSSPKELEQTYLIRINSTNCEKAESDPFVVCHETHFINLIINEVLLDSQTELYVRIFLLIVFLIFVALLVCGICMCKKWQAIMKKAKDEIKKLENKRKQYQDLQQA